MALKDVNGQNVVILAALSVIAIWAVTTLLEKLGWISKSISFGAGLTVLTLMLAPLLIFAIINKGFNFDRKGVALILLCVAMMVGIIFFLPGILPSLYSVGTQQIHLAVQSILG